MPIRRTKRFLEHHWSDEGDIRWFERIHGASACCIFESTSLMVSEKLYRVNPLRLKLNI